MRCAPMKCRAVLGIVSLLVVSLRLLCPSHVSVIIPLSFHDPCLERCTRVRQSKFLRGCSESFKHRRQNLHLRGGGEEEASDFGHRELDMAKRQRISAVMASLLQSSVDQELVALANAEHADASLFGSLCVTLVKQGDVASALVATFAALLLDPANPAWYNNAGTLLFLGTDSFSNDRIEHLLQQALRFAPDCSPPIYNYAHFIGTIPHKHPHNTKCRSRQLLGSALRDSKLVTALRDMSGSTAPIVSPCSSRNQCPEPSLHGKSDSAPLRLESSLTPVWINGCAWLLIPADFRRIERNSRWLDAASGLPPWQRDASLNATLAKSVPLAAALDLSLREAALLLLQSAAGDAPRLPAAAQERAPLGTPDKPPPAATHHRRGSGTLNSWQTNMLSCTDEEFWSMRAAPPAPLREVACFPASELLQQSEAAGGPRVEGEQWVVGRDGAKEGEAALRAANARSSEDAHRLSTQRRLPASPHSGHGLEEEEAGQRLVGRKRSSASVERQQGGAEDAGRAAPDAENAEIGGPLDVRVVDVKVLALQLAGAWPHRVAVDCSVCGKRWFGDGESLAVHTNTCSRRWRKQRRRLGLRVKRSAESWGQGQRGEGWREEDAGKAGEGESVRGEEDAGECRGGAAGQSPMTVSVVEEYAGLLGWGGNAQSQLGDGSLGDGVLPRGIPEMVAGWDAGCGGGLLDRIALPGPVGCGEEHGMAVARGKLHGWGSNRYGQLGRAPSKELWRIPRVVMEEAEGVEAVAGGGRMSLVLLANGSVVAWGAGLEHPRAPRGEGESAGAHAPRVVAGLPAAVAIAAGGQHALAVTRDGAVYGWGCNAAGQLGDGTVCDAERPVRCVGLGGGGPRATEVGAGAGHSLAVAEDGSVWAWGWNSSGQLGVENGGRGAGVGLVPRRVEGLERVRGCAAGGGHSVALTESGGVWTWGLNECGELGDGGKESRAEPRLVLEGAVEVGAGFAHSVAVMEGRATVMGWGHNNCGQLGDGSTRDRHTPVPCVLGNVSVLALAVGGDSTFVLCTPTPAPSFQSSRQRVQHPCLGVPSLPTASPRGRFLEFEGVLPPPWARLQSELGTEGEFEAVQGLVDMDDAGKPLAVHALVDYACFLIGSDRSVTETMVLTPASQHSLEPRLAAFAYFPGSKDASHQSPGQAGWYVTAWDVGGGWINKQRVPRGVWIRLEQGDIVEVGQDDGIERMCAFMFVSAEDGREEAQLG